MNTDFHRFERKSAFINVNLCPTAILPGGDVDGLWLESFLWNK